MKKTKLDFQFLNTIKGFMHDEEVERLYGVCLEASAKGPLLEVGSYCGRSAVVIGQACKENTEFSIPLTTIKDPRSSSPGKNTLTLISMMRPYQG